MRKINLALVSRPPSRLKHAQDQPCARLTSSVSAEACARSTLRSSHVLRLGWSMRKINLALVSRPPSRLKHAQDQPCARLTSSVSAEACARSTLRSSHVLRLG